MRATELKEGEFYHIYNRGTDKREVFLHENDYIRFLVSMKEFNRADAIGSLYEKNFKDKTIKKEIIEGILGTKSPIGDLVPKIPSKLVDIVCYCLNSNHFHFILKQLASEGVSKFMHKVASGYTTYFNKKYNRSDSLFQGPFKSVHIESSEQLLYLSAYVNMNHFIHGYGNNPWKYSSLLDYMGEKNGTLCSKGVILNQFSNNVRHYGDFLKENAMDLKERKELEKYRLEE